MWWERNGQTGLNPKGPDKQPLFPHVELTDLPLYRIAEALAQPECAVILTEGEGKCDVLNAALNDPQGPPPEFVAVATATGGGPKGPGDESLRPLAGREVYLWPDNDEPGRQHMQFVGARLKALGAHVRTIRWEGAPEKGDAADFFENGAMVGAFYTMAEEAEELADGQEDEDEVDTVEPLLTLGPVRQEECDLGGVDAALPEHGWLLDYVRFGCDTSESPAQYHLAGGLAVLSVAVSRWVWMPWGYGRLYPNLYLALIGAQARPRKSTAVMMASDLLRDCFPPWVERVESKNGGEPEERTRMGAVIPWDGSYEGIVDAMQDNPHGIMTPNELSALIAATGRSYNAGLQQLLADAYDCPAHITRKLKHETIIIERPVPSILGASSLSWLTQQTDQNALEGGFLSRFTYFFATRTGELKPIRPVADSQRWNALKQDLMALRQAVGNTDGRQMAFAPDAKEAYARFYFDVEGRPMDEEGALAGFISRLTISAVKIAMLFQIADDCASSEITLPVWQKAEALAGYLRRGAEHFVMGAEGDKWLKQRQKIYGLIPEPPTWVTRRDLMRASKVERMSFDRSIETLLGAGLIAQREYKPLRGPSSFCYAREVTVETVRGTSVTVENGGEDL